MPRRRSLSTGFTAARRRTAPVRIHSSIMRSGPRPTRLVAAVSFPQMASHLGFSSVRWGQRQQTLCRPTSRRNLHGRLPSPRAPAWLPSPWAGGPTAVTLVFAVYAFGLLAALLVGGSLSDHVGRRPVLIVSLLVEIAAMVVFIEAAGLGWLLVARGIQGGWPPEPRWAPSGPAWSICSPCTSRGWAPWWAVPPSCWGWRWAASAPACWCGMPRRRPCWSTSFSSPRSPSPSPAWCSCRRRPRDGPALSAHSCPGRRCPVGCVRRSWSSRQASWLSGPSAVSISRWDPH